MGYVKTNDQCSSRWRKHIGPAALEKRALKAKSTTPESRAPGEGGEGEEGGAAAAGEGGEVAAKKNDAQDAEDKDDGDDKGPVFWTEEQV